MLFTRRIAMIVSILALGGCMLSTTMSPTPPPPSAPTDVPGVVSTWEMLASGLERRVYRPHGDNFLTQILILRVDPTQYSFRVHYRPGQPLDVRNWRDSLPGATIFVNANFFDENDQALGLLVADGITYGAAYNGYGGMFQVQNGQPRVRSNILEPYIGEALEQAVQGFPVLVANGVQSYDNTRGDNFARRTIVAQDSRGRILLMVTPLVGMTLVELSEYLPTTDLELVNAINLDGGGSTMLYLNVSGSPEYALSSFDPVPSVLAVYPRQ